jgi:hypothetical protein
LERQWIPVWSQEAIRHEGQTQIGGIEHSGKMTAEAKSAASDITFRTVGAVIGTFDRSSGLVGCDCHAICGNERRMQQDADHGECQNSKHRVCG